MTTIAWGLWQADRSLQLGPSCVEWKHTESLADRKAPEYDWFVGSANHELCPFPQAISTQ